MRHAQNITSKQLELLKSFKHLTSDSEINEVKSLLNFYFRKKLDNAIELEEKSRNYTASVYEEWLAKSEK